MKTPINITNEEVQALLDVIEYMIGEEAHDYWAEGMPNNHIYLELIVIINLLLRVSAAAKEPLKSEINNILDFYKGCHENYQ